MALANRTKLALTNEQRATLTRTLRSGLVAMFVNAQLAVHHKYRDGTYGNRKCPYVWYADHMGKMRTFLAGCQVPNPQGLGSNHG